MGKSVLFVVWQVAKITIAMLLAVIYMRAAVFCGATQLEAGFSAVVASVVIAAATLGAVIGAAADSFHLKVDGLVTDVEDIRKNLTNDFL